MTVFTSPCLFSFQGTKISCCRLPPKVYLKAQTVMLWGHSSLHHILMLKHYLSDQCQRLKVKVTMTSGPPICESCFSATLLNRDFKYNQCFVLRSHERSLFSTQFLYNCRRRAPLLTTFHTVCASIMLGWRSARRTHNFHQQIFQNNELRINVHQILFADSELPLKLLLLWPRGYQLLSGILRI